MKYLSVNYNMQILFQGVIYLFGNIGKDPRNVYPNCRAYYCSNQVETPFTTQPHISLSQKVAASASASDTGSLGTTCFSDEQGTPRG